MGTAPCAQAQLAWVQHPAPRHNSHQYSTLCPGMARMGTAPRAQVQHAWVQHPAPRYVMHGYSTLRPGTAHMGTAPCMRPGRAQQRGVTRWRCTKITGEGSKPGVFLRKVEAPRALQRTCGDILTACTSGYVSLRGLHFHFHFHFQIQHVGVSQPRCSACWVGRPGEAPSPR